jgi:tetratricopeptide (TPR) repeat protein
VTNASDERFARAVALREAGKLDEARTVLLELRAEQPEDAHVAVQTAWVHDSLGLEDEAVAHYEAAIAGDLSEEELRGALLGLGSTYRALGRDADSERTLRAGIERFPDFLALRAFAALTDYNLGRSREAVGELVKLLAETSPDLSIQRYRRALDAYADDLDRSWLTDVPARVPEARLEPTEHGLRPDGDGWFVLNARDARWRHVEGRTAVCGFEGTPDFPQFGLNLSVVLPGEGMSMYHWEADQEDFLVLSGEAILIAEGEERALRRWDLVHCPAGAKHAIVGAGSGPCLVLAVGARDRSVGPAWGGYAVDEGAGRHGVSVERDTTEPDEAYAHLPARKPVRCRDGWLPD